MLNDLVSAGYKTLPLFVTLYGAEGAGKSTFASQAPKPLFIDFENGSNFLDVNRIQPKSYLQFIEILKMLETEKHDYQTLVIDSVDFAEEMLSDYVCEMNGKKNLEDWGYGAGYKYLSKAFFNFLSGVERLRQVRGMHIIFIAHCSIRKFEDPRLQQSYDRYTLKLYHANAERLKESSDFLLYAGFQDMTTGGGSNSQGGKAKGISTGKRLLMTQRAPAFDAKSRVNIPEQLDLSWSSFFHSIYPQESQVQKQL